MTTLDDLLAPKSVAIVGASDNPERIGGRPIQKFQNLGYEGHIYPVNPNRDVVQGIQAYPTLSDISGEVDFVLVAVPAKGVLDVVREAATKKAKTVMIFSSGFSEMSEAGRRAQDELTRISRDSGVRIIGPNCFGVFNAAINFYPTFSSTIGHHIPTPGGLAIISQSGGYGAQLFVLAHQRGLKMTYWITTGNECDVNVAEGIKLLAENDAVQTILAYAESIKDGEMLVEGLEVARAAHKPVIFMKAGSSEIGAAAVSSHTASLAGEDVIYDAVLKQYGAYRPRATEEAIEVAYAAAPRIFPVGKRIGLASISGGAGVLMADAATDYDLNVAEMPADAQTEMKKLLPFASARNPVDITAQVVNDMTLVTGFTKLMLNQGKYDALVGFWASAGVVPELGSAICKALAKAMEGQDNKLFIQSLVAGPEMRKQFEEAGFPCIEDPYKAVATMAALISCGMAFAAGRPAIPDIPNLPALPEGPLGEKAAKKILADFGLPLATDTLATSSAEAAAAAERIGGPVAMKIASPDILHKTDVGGVKLGITGGDNVSTTYDEIIASSKAAVPNAKIEGVLISAMAADGVDCILGAKVDPVFGPVVMFGLGGVFTEILKDVSFRRAPVSPETALGMIDELKGAALLKGARGAEPCDLDSICDAISKLSVMAVAHSDNIESIEMNPLRALPEGCIGLDALIVKRT